MNYQEIYKNWCTSTLFDDSTKAELEQIANNKAEIKDRFYKELSFGTGGLRGVIGAGTNRMNLYTVGKATQGLANFILKENGQDRGVAIAYDSRNMSEEFSEAAALCLNANGIKTYRFESLRPTPELSFAVRKLNCIAGIVITASHNPPEYNGYKVYWEDGAQITPPKDSQIIYEVNAVTDYSQIKTTTRQKAVNTGLYHTIGKEIDDAYLSELKKLILNFDAIQQMAENLRIVYTPLHGSGNLLVRRILKELGFKQIYVVSEQELPDGNFPTVSCPNPEDPSVFQLALKLAKNVDADLIIATDPDADRLGVYAKDPKTGGYMPFTGNMSGLLIAEYELSQRRKLNILPANGALVTTIVSSDMAKAMAKEYHIHLVEVLTGFKYIGEQIKLFEERKKQEAPDAYEYLFGYEESYGCLIGTYARDKDAVSTAMALCEAAAYYKQQGLTLWEQMLNIYEKYGYYTEDLASITLKGADGAETIKQIILHLRQAPPKLLGNSKVLAIRDYLTGIRTDLISQKHSQTELPQSDVLYFELENDGWCCVRPSGTEPKIKFYMGVKGTTLENAQATLQSIKTALLDLTT